MAFKHGKDAIVKINAVDLSTFLDSAELTYDVDNEVFGLLGGSTGGKRAFPGQYGAKFSVGGKYDPTDITGPVMVITGLIGDDAFPCVYRPGGNAIGQTDHAFNAIVGSFAESAPVGGMVAFKADFTVDGSVITTVISA